MGRILTILILLSCAAGAGWDFAGKKGIFAQSLNITQITQAKISTAPKSRHVDDIILISQAEVDLISQQVQKKYENQDFTPIHLSDGTQIPLKFTPNGRICSRTGLPEGNISLDAKLAISQ